MAPQSHFKIIPLYIIYRHHTECAARQQYKNRQKKNLGENKQKKKKKEKQREKLCLRRHCHISSAIVHHAEPRHTPAFYY